MIRILNEENFYVSRENPTACVCGRAFFVGNSFLLRAVKCTNAFVYLEFYGCYICVDGIYFVTSHGFELLYKGVCYK